ncbi:MAG: hypothetical protein D6776_05990, partial [Planctomycetota bacterium]
MDGAVQDGRVDTVRLDAFGAFQDFRGSVRTLDDGSYRQAIPGAGFYQVDVVSGSYTDPITGESVDLGSRGMHLRAIGVGPGTINVSNVTTLAAALTARELATGVSMTAALATASDAIGDLFSVGLVRFDPLTTTPANLRDGSFTGGITPESLYGAVLEALSQLAFERDQQTSSPGSGAISALELTEAMARDLRDGALDGVDASVSPPERVTIGTTGVELVRAGTPFMADLGTAVVAAAPPSLAAADLAAIQSAWAGQSGATDAAAPTISSVESSFGGTPARVHARGGDTITIHGTGFDASAAVWVDTVQATVQSVSATAIVAEVNADSPGLKRVTVATTAGSASALEAVRLVGDAFDMDAVNLPGAPVIAGDPDLSFTAGNVVDELGEPVLDGDTFTLTLTFTPDTHAGAGAQPALSATSVTTNAGAISFDVDPGEVTGQFRIEVDADPGIAHQEILITVQPGAPATVTLASSRSQIAADGTSQAQLTGTVTDAFGNRVADGTQVTLAASPGTFGTVSSPVTTTVGDYASSFTVGTTVGQEQITATAGGVSSSPVTIDIVPDVPAQLTDFAIGNTSLSTDGTNGPSFTTVSGVIRDAGGNPVGGGFQVDILVLGPIAPQVSPVTTISDGSFAAVVTATGTPGAATVTAQLVSNPAIFDGTTLTVNPGVQHTVTLAANPATGLVAGVTQVTVSGTVTDSLGNAIPGVNVDLVTTVGTFTSSGTGNATVATDANGAYSATIDPPTATSNGTVSATSGGVSASPVALSYEPGDPAQIVGYTLSPATLSADGGVATATGRVLDQFGNAVKVGTNVDITVAGPIAAQQTPVVTAAADGSFSATVNTTGGVGSATVTATVQGFPAVTESATLTVEVGAVDSVTLVASPATGLVAGVTVVQVSGVVTDQ